MSSRVGAPFETVALDCALLVFPRATVNKTTAQKVRYNWPDKKTPFEVAKAGTCNLEAVPEEKGDLAEVNFYSEIRTGHPDFPSRLIYLEGRSRIISGLH